MESRALWLAVARRSLVECNVSKWGISTPLERMDLLQIQKLSTRPLRFLHHLHTFGDFSRLPTETINLKASPGVECVPWPESGISYLGFRIIRGGRFIVGIILGEAREFAASNVLLCWDMLRVPLGGGSIFPVASSSLRQVPGTVPKLIIATPAYGENFMIARMLVYGRTDEGCI